MKFSYRRVDLLSPDELHHTVKLHYQIEDQLNYKNHDTLTDSINEITTTLKLPPLNEVELTSGIDRFFNMSNNEYWQVQYERMDIWENIARNNKRDNELKIIDLQLLLNDIVVGSIYLITDDTLIARGKKTIFFREVITLPAYRIISYYHRIGGIFKLLLDEIIRICRELGVEVLISDPFDNVSEMLECKFNFLYNEENENISLNLPGIGLLRQYEVYRLV